MSDHYLDDKGNIAFIEGTDDNKSKRTFKPIAFYDGITVYEEQSNTVIETLKIKPQPDTWDC